jgi:hypothetical protein
LDIWLIAWWSGCSVSWQLVSQTVSSSFTKFQEQPAEPVDITSCYVYCLWIIRVSLIISTPHLLLLLTALGRVAVGAVGACV